MDIKTRIKSVLNITAPVFMTKYYYRKILKKKLDLKSPTSLNEKINWLKLYYWPYQKISTVVADKYMARDYVKEKGCGNLLNSLIGVWDRVNDIPWDTLPEQFVIKCGHGCGMNIICFQKSQMDKNAVFNKLNTWMKTDWGKNSCEPHYSNIKPKIICEAFLGNSQKKELPDDIKIHCFHGKPEFIAYYSERANDLHGTFYDIEWKHLDIATKEGALVDKPKCLTDLLSAAEILSSDLPYARIDFYVIDSKPFFGEITLTPASGRSTYMREEYDIKYGNLLDLSKCGFNKNN